jgi:hypothetical protein
MRLFDILQKKVIGSAVVNIFFDDLQTFEGPILSDVKCYWHLTTLLLHQNVGNLKL